MGWRHFAAEHSDSSSSSSSTSSEQPSPSLLSFEPERLNFGVSERGVRLRLDDELEGAGDGWWWCGFVPAVVRDFFFFFDGGGVPPPPSAAASLGLSVEAMELTLGEGEGSLRFRFLRFSSSSFVC
jgi:hypothetical protein